MSALHLTADNFEAEVLHSDQPVLVDFWADWCAPCKMLGPIVEEIAAEVTDVKVAKVDVDAQQSLAIEYKVMSIPTLILFKNGKAVAQSVGVKPKQDILNMIHK